MIVVLQTLLWAIQRVSTFPSRQYLALTERHAIGISAIEGLVVAAVRLDAVSAHVRLGFVLGLFGLLRMPSTPGGCGGTGNGQRNNSANSSKLHDGERKVVGELV